MRILNANGPNTGETMDRRGGRSMTPEIAHVDRETWSEGSLGHADQLHTNKYPMLDYENLEWECPTKNGWEYCVWGIHPEIAHLELENLVRGCSCTS
ncbi:predicted protein [Lichtheimia corymbifera JMRC:FSU:9682]|uniref:Uncharacterized protein n=1 Tax=Lichtheimia corymbifera JMRC:FSU:9682 TaxID=1263082 RepID=A0A068RFW8_9FUNG|nr:predicted protein [Lichtheimia corymbifera JMRC:FSU:9682]